MRAWLEYNGRAIGGDRVYTREVAIPDGLASFPMYDRMDLKDELWMVYAPVVRSFLSSSWTDGGHHYQYPFIKPRELWISSNTYEEEIPVLYSKLAISKFLIRDYKLSMVTSDVIGMVFSGTLRDQYFANSSNLKSLFQKKATLTIERPEGTDEVQRIRSSIDDIQGSEKMDQGDKDNLISILVNYGEELRGKTLHNSML